MKTCSQSRTSFLFSIPYNFCSKNIKLIINGTILKPNRQYSQSLIVK